MSLFNPSKKGNHEKITLNIFAALTMPLAAHAGMSVDVNIKNKIVQDGSDYPRLTAHITGGSNCWYDYGLADWSQYAPPGGSVSIYTERKNSGWSCFGAIGTRNFTLFMQQAPGAEIVPITPQYRLYVNGNSRLDGFTTTYSDRSYWENRQSSDWATQQAGCGLAIQARTDLPDPACTWFEVSGTPIENCAGYVYPVTNSALRNPAEPVEKVIVNMKLGAKKAIALGGLDDDSVWELGECIGDSVLADNVVPHNTKKKFYPRRLV
jgi:hypothetical protein